MVFGMPFEDAKILEFNQYRKSDVALSFIYVDLESLIKRIEGHRNHSEKSSRTKVYIPSGYSVSAIWIFDGIENKQDVLRGKDFMKKFSE